MSTGVMMMMLRMMKFSLTFSEEEGEDSVNNVHIM